MILRTLTIGHVVNVIKEKEIDGLVTPWINAPVAYLLTVFQATTTLEDNKIATQVLDPTEYNKVVTTLGSKKSDTFSSRIIHAWMETAFTNVRLNVMTHTLCAEEESLPQGLMIQNTYSEMCNGSKNITVVVRSSTVYHQTQKKKILVARVVAANWVPKPHMQPGMIDALDETQCIQTQKLTTEQRQEKLVPEVKLEQLGILATRAGRFHSVVPH